MKARWRGWSRSTVPRPSIVVMRPFATAETGVTHERVGFPSTRTVQAPHWARPHPNFGPFNARSFLRMYRSGASGSTVTVLVSPFTRSVKLAMVPSAVWARPWIPSSGREDRMIHGVAVRCPERPGAATAGGIQVLLLGVVGRVGGRRAPQLTPLLLVVTIVAIVHLPADFPTGEAVGVDIRVDGIVLDGFEKGIEGVHAVGEPLAGKREDLRRSNGPGHWFEVCAWAWARRGICRYGCRRRIVRRLAQPHVDAAGGVLLAEVEMSLVDELGVGRARREDSVGELVGEFVGDLPILLVDLELEPAAAGRENGTGAGAECATSREARRDHFVESRKVSPQLSVVVVCRARRGDYEGEQSDRRHEGPDESVHPYASFKDHWDTASVGYLSCSAPSFLAALAGASDTAACHALGARRVHSSVG